MYASRVTIDIDSYVRSPRTRVLRAYHGLQQAGADDVEVAVSSSGGGFHLVGYFAEPLATETKLRIRENLGDDPKRIHMDRQRAARGLPTQTMWSEKGGNEGQRQVFDTPEDALTHVEATGRTAHQRAKAIQNYGHRALKDDQIPHLKGVSGQTHA